MNLFDVIGAVGLLLDMFGAFILWKWGVVPSPPFPDGGVPLLVDGFRDIEAVKRYEDREKKSKWGFPIIFLGFLLQFISYID